MNAFHPLFTHQFFSAAKRRPDPTPSKAIRPASFERLTTAPPDASAPSESSDSYACILSDETFLYPAEEEKDALFLIPKTYYVKVVERGEEYSLVEYGSGTPAFPTLSGYCKTEELTFVDYTPARPYPQAEIRLTYTLEDALPSSLSTFSVTASYYGDYAVGSTLYCYVYAGDNFGYVVRPDFTLEQNTDYLPSSNPPKQPESFPYTPLILGSAVVVLLFVSFLAALRSRSPRSRDWYEESSRDL